MTVRGNRDRVKAAVHHDEDGRTQTIPHLQENSPFLHLSHPENPPPRPHRLFRAGLPPQGSAQPLRQNAPGVRGRNHAIVPHAGRGKKGVALALDARFQVRVGERGLADRFHDGRELLGAHDADFGVGPHPEEAWRVGASAGRGMVSVCAGEVGREGLFIFLQMGVVGGGEERRGWLYVPHAVIPRSSAGSEDDGEFGHVSASDGRDQLCAVLGDPPFLRVGADHESADVLQEDKRDVSLGAELDEVRAFERGLREKNPVVGQNANLLAVDASEACKALRLDFEREEKSEKHKGTLPVTSVAP